MRYRFGISSNGPMFKRLLAAATASTAIKANTAIATTVFFANLIALFLVDELRDKF
jgi:preprotein translocase subunit SecG